MVLSSSGPSLLTGIFASPLRLPCPRRDHITEHFQDSIHAITKIKQEADGSGVGSLGGGGLEARVPVVRSQPPGGPEGKCSGGETSTCKGSGVHPTVGGVHRKGGRPGPLGHSWSCILHNCCSALRALLPLGE